MTWTNWNAIATALADYVREVARSAAPGTATIQFPADGSRVLGVFGSVEEAADEKAGGSVEQLRQQLREAGVRELGFGLSKDGHTWAVVIEEDNMLATCLDQVARERSHETSSVPADVPTARQHPRQPRASACRRERVEDGDSPHPNPTSESARYALVLLRSRPMVIDSNPPMPPFRPLRRVDGYLPLEDHGLIGDGATAALVGRDGAILWLCVPRFDAPPLFCSLLDARRGGFFTVAPDGLVESRQGYAPDSGVLVTQLRGPSGLVRITDALTFRSGADLTEDAPATRGELVRSVEVLEGEVRLRIEVEPRGGGQAEPRGDGLRVRCPSRPDLDLQLHASGPLDGLRSLRDLRAGARLQLVLRWGARASRYHPTAADDLLRETLAVWRRWVKHFDYEGPQEPLVRRSAIVLKLLDHVANGAIVAAPTSSLPERIGGVRNWDYRYTWVRDAAFSVYALRRIGLHQEAWGFLGWVLDAIEHAGRPHVLYDLDGGQPPPEREDPELEGYRGSRPVRWGNAAAEQRQHDVYGEILDCAFQWMTRGGEIDGPLWERLRQLVEAARREWQQPDHGIWEVRTPGRPFTYSAALCHVALDRAARMAERLGLPGDVEGWRADAERIRQAILEEAWDAGKNSLTEHLGGGGLDASLLTLPLRRVVPADHPRMAATTAAIVKRLGAGNGLLYRYLPDVSPDGLPGDEGAFLLCSCWLVDNLALQGHLEEALELYDSLCARAGALGLLPEQIDPATGAFLGNYPQAFSHVGLISSGVTLARLLRKRET